MKHILVQFSGEVMSDEVPELRTKLVQRLWKSLEEQSVVDISHYNALLGVLTENNQPLSVEEVLTDLQSKNLTPNRATFYRILHNYSRRGDLHGVERVLAIMKTERIELNEKIYNSLILAHGFGG